MSSAELPPAKRHKGDQHELTATSDSVSVSQFPTLARYIMARTGDSELTILLTALALACKATSRACNKAGIACLFGLAGDVNSTGDDQKKLDVLSNDIFIDALTNCGACAVLVSEENEDPIFVPESKVDHLPAEQAQCSSWRVFKRLAQTVVGESNVGDGSERSPKWTSGRRKNFRASTQIGGSTRGRHCKPKKNGDCLGPINNRIHLSLLYGVRSMWHFLFGHAPLVCVHSGRVD